MPGSLYQPLFARVSLMMPRVNTPRLSNSYAGVLTAGAENSFVMIRLCGVWESPMPALREYSSQLFSYSERLYCNRLVTVSSGLAHCRATDAPLRVRS